VECAWKWREGDSTTQPGASPSPGLLVRLQEHTFLFSAFRDGRLVLLPPATSLRHGSRHGAGLPLTK
jgi:hypothetical protein